MKILVTGASGQLGKDLVNILANEHDVVGFGREELDVTDLDVTKAQVQSIQPDAIVHAAAYTAVDRAETEIDEAFRVNAVGSRNVAVAAEEISAKVCYISTDYVFDGTLDRPYREYDPVGPRSIYGQSKLAGEVLTQSLLSRYFIVRTSWVFGLHGSNFVKTMLKLAAEGKSLQVVNDQRGCPTYTVDLAQFIKDLIVTDQYGVYHASNTGDCTWFEFAEEIFKQAGLSVTLNSCTTSEFPRPAPRPRNSVLDDLAKRTNGFQQMPAWQDALSRFLQEYRTYNV